MIGVDGSQLGLFAIRDAQRVADDQGLDLVEIAPNAEPPVCKVMDYGKFKYQQAMKAKAARKNQSKVEVKEMKFRPKIDVGDYETKKGHVLRFLKKGARVKITIMFRGREMAHPEQGLSGTKKRFRKTGTGKLMRAKAFKSHILSKKSTTRKRGFRQETEIAAADRKVIKSRLA